MYFSDKLSFYGKHLRWNSVKGRCKLIGSCLVSLTVHTHSVYNVWITFPADTLSKHIISLWKSMDVFTHNNLFIVLYKHSLTVLQIRQRMPNIYTTSHRTIIHSAYVIFSLFRMIYTTRYNVFKALLYELTALNLPMYAFPITIYPLL